MPIIYCQNYTPVSDSIAEISAQEHQLGLTLLTQGLKNIYDISLSVRDLDKYLKRTDSGKPFLSLWPHIHFNISHCSGLAACVFDSRPVGLDVEMPGYFPEVLIDRALCPREKQYLDQPGISQSLLEEWFFRFWTLKEAYVKKTGTGVDVPLKDFSFTFTREQTGYSVTCSDSRVFCYQTILKSRHILSVCHEDSTRDIRLNICP